MTQSFRFAHLSDIHLPTFISDGTNPVDFLNKRFFSALSWFGNRRFIHLKTVSDTLVGDCLKSAPDHIIVTGDLINLSLPGEYSRATKWLQSLGSPETVSAIPGNHDLLLDNSRTRKGLAQYTPYMQGDDQGGSLAFPFVKRRGKVLIIGLSTAIETPLGWCSGRLGEQQRLALFEILQQGRKDGLCRIITLHHPPAGPQKQKKGLEDHQEFARIIAELGAELILHGHTHRSSIHALPGPTGPVSVMGVASLSVAPDKGYPVGCWHEYEVQREKGEWKISLNVHQYAGQDIPPNCIAKALLRSA